MDLCRIGVRCSPLIPSFSISAAEYWLQARKKTFPFDIETNIGQRKFSEPTSTYSSRPPCFDRFTDMSGKSAGRSTAGSTATAGCEAL